MLLAAKAPPTIFSDCHLGIPWLRGAAGLITVSTDKGAP
jgi:hypothetical protein